MPNRVIREGLLDSKTINKLSFPEECLFSRLMLIVDDYGRFEYNMSFILARTFPLRIGIITLDEIQQWMNKLEDVGLLFKYSVDHVEYFQLNNFKQQLRRMRSKYPEPRNFTVHEGAVNRRQNADKCPTVDGQSTAKCRPESESESESETESEIYIDHLADDQQAKSEEKKPREKKQYSPEFLELWKIWKRTESKTRAFEYFNGRMKDGFTLDQLKAACTAKVKEYERENGNNYKFLPHLSSFIAPEGNFLLYLDKLKILPAIAEDVSQLPTGYHCGDMSFLKLPYKIVKGEKFWFYDGKWYDDYKMSEVKDKWLQKRGMAC